MAGVRVRLSGWAPKVAALDLHRATEAALALADVPPDLTRAQKRLIRPRFRTLADATSALAPRLVKAVKAMRDAFFARLGLREAAASDDDLRKFDAALDAMTGDEIQHVLTSTYHDLYRQGIQLARVELDDTFTLKPMRSLAALDRTALTFADSVAHDEREWLKAAIRDALAEGMFTHELVGEITNHFADGIHRTDANGQERTVDLESWATMVARTETARALNLGALDTYKAAHVDYLIWIAGEDERTCPICVAADRTVAAVDEEFHATGTSVPPAHVNCFPSGTMVASVAVWNAATVRDYVGDLVRIRLSSGHELAATPNHPVATRRGWVAIAELNEGDSVLYRTPRQPPSANPQNQDVEACIEQVADTFAVASARVPTASEDFHGDGGGSEIHIVRTNRELRDDGDPLVPKRERKFDLVAGRVRKRARDAARTSLAMLFRLRFSANRVMRRFCARNSRVLTRALGLYAVCFASATDGNPFREQAPPDDGPGCVESLRERELAFTGDVAGRNGHRVDAIDAVRPDRNALLSQATANDVDADAEGFCEKILALTGLVASGDVVTIERKAWNGQVYNLESATGWFFANGIVTHNCRCTVVGLNELTAKLVAPGDLPDDADLGATA